MAAAFLPWCEPCGSHGHRRSHSWLRRLFHR